MRDMPLNELLAATDLDRIQDALVLIFGHINKKLKISPYPIRRALPLVEAISRDLNDQLLRVLGALRIMQIEPGAAERALGAASAIFQTWDDQLKEFTNVARDVTRRRSEKFIPIKINPAHARLQERIAYVRAFRKQHDQLARMLHPTRGIGVMAASIGGAATRGSTIADVDMEDEVRAAYELVKGVDVLDTSAEGTTVWLAAEEAYNERVSRVENQIIALLRDRLGAARNTRELLRVFSRFNALFVRAKVRSAVQDHQSQLLDSVKDDIRRLHEKFKQSYKHSEAYHMAQLRDLPPIAGAIQWARQIERQLSAYMKRVEDVLGKGWELYAEGQRLQTESSSFRRKLDTRPIYDAWLHEINRRDLQISGRLFEVGRTRAPGGGGGTVFVLAVNFDPQIITLFKEVRNLLWLGFQVPHAIGNIAKDAKRVYPHAVSLMETVRTYAQTCDRVLAHPGIAPLVAEYRTDAQTMISRGLDVRWENFIAFRPTTAGGRDVGDHGAFVREFASAVAIFQDRTNTLIDVYAELLADVDALGTCAYTPAAFAEVLARIQKTVDRLNLEGYANLETWVADFDRRIERVLVGRLAAVIDVWCAQLAREEDADGRTGRVSADKALAIRPITHEVCIRNQVIYLDPPVEHARADWYGQLQAWLAVVCGLKRVQSSRYEIGLKIQTEDAEDAYYASLVRLQPWRRD